MREEAISLYMPEDLENDMRRCGMLVNSWGNGISAAVGWTAANCENIDSLLPEYIERQRAARALIPCRRTSAVLTPNAYQTLLDVAPGDVKLSAVVKAIVRHFVDTCDDIPKALDYAVAPLARPRSIQSMPVRFDYETMVQLRTIAAARGCSDGEVVINFVKQGIAQQVTGDSK